MKANYTITTISHKWNKIQEGERQMTIKDARRMVEKICGVLAISHQPHEYNIVIMKNGKIAFPKLHEHLKNIINATSGKSLFEEIQH